MVGQRGAKKHSKNRADRQTGLELAVQLLDPIPASVEDHDPNWDRDLDMALGLGRVFSGEKNAPALCKNLVAAYRLILKREQRGGVSPSMIRRTLLSTKKHYEALAAWHENIGFDQYRMIFSTYEIDPELREELLPLNWINQIDGPVETKASNYLRAQARRFDALLSAAPKRTKGGRGNNVVRSLGIPAPGWQLVYMCARVFQFLHRPRPTTATDSDFDQFVTAIHEAAKGNPGKSFAAHIRQYVRLGFDQLVLCLRLGGQRFGWNSFVQLEHVLAGAQNPSRPMGRKVRGEFEALRDQYCEYRLLIWPGAVSMQRREEKRKISAGGTTPARKLV